MHNDSLPHSAFRGVYPLSSSDACWGKVGVPKWRSEMGALGGFDKANLGKYALEVEAARVWDAEARFRYLPFQNFNYVSDYRTTEEKSAWAEVAAALLCAAAAGGGDDEDAAVTRAAAVGDVVAVFDDDDDDLSCFDIAQVLRIDGGAEEGADGDAGAEGAVSAHPIPCTAAK